MNIIDYYKNKRLQKDKYRYYRTIDYFTQLGIESYWILTWYRGNKMMFRYMDYRNFSPATHKQKSVLRIVDLNTFNFKDIPDKKIHGSTLYLRDTGWSVEYMR